MKLNTPKEIADKKQAETARDIARTKEVKEELLRVTKELEEVEAKFNLALSNQRARWAKEEEEALDRLHKLEEEKRLMEKKLELLGVPIVEREKKSYALFTEAESTFEQARKELYEAEQSNEENRILQELLEEKIDELTDRETDVALREQKVLIKEKAVEEQREQIKKLSSELSIKLTHLT